MNEKVKCLMLIDDNADDNFIHGREIKKAGFANIIIIHESGLDALEYLRSQQLPHVDLIFLDINMPRMNGWEFLEAYSLLDKEIQSRTVIIMLTTSDYPGDIEKAKTWNFVSDYKTKPLTLEIMNDIHVKYFNN